MGLWGSLAILSGLGPEDPGSKHPSGCECPGSPIYGESVILWEILQNDSAPVTGENYESSSLLLRFSRSRSTPVHSVLSMVCIDWLKVFMSVANVAISLRAKRTFLSEVGE